MRAHRTTGPMMRHLVLVMVLGIGVRERRDWRLRRLCARLEGRGLLAVLAVGVPRHAQLHRRKGHRHHRVPRRLAVPGRHVQRPLRQRVSRATAD